MCFFGVFLFDPKGLGYLPVFLPFHDDLLKKAHWMLSICFHIDLAVCQACFSFLRIRTYFFGKGNCPRSQ